MTKFQAVTAAEAILNVAGYKNFKASKNCSTVLL
jgi:hypothetical protein